MIIVHIFRGLEGRFGLTTDELGANLPTSLAPWSYKKTIELNETDPPRVGVRLPPRELFEIIKRDGCFIDRPRIRSDAI